VVQGDAAVYTTKRNLRHKKNSKAKERLIEEIKEAVKFINLVKQGKRKARPAKELLDEL
jgi:RNA-splicing ligase RtcB